MENLAIPWQAVRCPANPLIRPGMPGLAGHAAANINGPSAMRVPVWLPKPLGRYYLYFAHHRDSYIRLAYADDLAGPWTVHPPGVLALAETAARDHIASPDVHVDEARREIRMYFHGAHPQRRGQVSYVATSLDGLHFSVGSAELGPPYFRVFQFGGWYYAVAKENGSGRLLRSRDGLGPFKPGPAIIPGMRHAAVLLEGSRLWLFCSRIGDSPERIVLSHSDLEGDWLGWQAAEPATLLRPEEGYEGAGLPVGPSQSGVSWVPVCQLRDPGILVDGGRLYLFYSVAGEQGIALAELRASRP